MAAWRNEILAGVESVKYQGCVPGYIIVYGDNSDAILTNETGETLIAAGELGQGRVVVFSHNTFTKSYLKPDLPKENETLLLNVKAWVTRGKSTVAVDVDGTNCFDKIPANGLLVWSGEKKDDTFLNKMVDWIRNGGGLVCGTCPWGYAQVTGTAIENMPLNFIMSKLGMNYATCEEYFSTSNELSVHVNCAEFARLDKAFDLVMAGGDVCKVKKVLGNISSTLHEVWQRRLKAEKAASLKEKHATTTAACIWRDEILAGVESVKYQGCVPGYIIVYGDNSDAILTNETGETLIAAGELGQGRVVVFSHNTFTKSYLKPELPKENETLLLNVKAWVTRGKDTVAMDVDEINCFDKIPANGFLVWSGEEKDDTFLNKMADWIRNGGGLVCGTCPWGYAQVTGIAIENMPLNFIMSKLGMNYATCDDYFSTSNELSVHVNCAEFARLDKMVDLVRAGGDVCKVKKVLGNISSSLHEVWQRRLKAEKAASLKEKHATTTAACIWRDEILAGVESVKYQGCVPGYIIVYGDNSDAILTNETGETLIAAGELGQGRVVVFSHNTFTKSYLKPDLPKENETLLLNVKAWVTRGKDTVAVNVDGTNCFDEVPANGFLVWSGEKKDDTFLNKMADWIRNGGGLVCGTCPWGYAQVTGIAIENMPLNFIMSKLGMNYATCDDYFSTSNELSVHVNCAEFARLDKAVDLMQAGGDVCKVKKTLGNISSIPHEVWLQRVQPAIDSLKQEWHCIPTKDKRTASTKEKLAATMLCNLMIKDGLAGEPVVAEGCNEFPGDFDEPPRLEVTTIEIIGKENQYVPTGCYLPAGKEMYLSWGTDGASNASGWSVVIGAHTDELFGVEGAWRRWPKVSIKRTLENNPLKICSPFGGLVYMVSPKAPSHLTVTLRNIVPAPRFTFETAGSWDLERRKPGLWTDISGDLITFTMPSKSIRQLNDPCHTMRLWDEVVKAHMELRGCDPSRGRGQWVVTDEQPSCGYMHSGYPIVTHLDVADPTHEHGSHFLMNGDGIVNPCGHGFWGLFHELGHNFQHGFWTWAGTGEVTVNIFTLHAMDTLCKLKPWIHPWLAGHMSEVKAYLQGGADFDKWKSDPGVALTIYAQQARDFGWEPFKTVFREYEALPTSEQPKNYEEKIRQWIVRFSRATGRNLCPAFEFWGFPCTDVANGFLGDLPPYLPADETTLEMAPDRAREISVKYNVN